MSASRSALIEIALCVAALTGCMAIYPDPELPDIEVTWYDGYCSEGASMVLSLGGVDDATFAQQLTVPCTDQTATFQDVAREQFTLEAWLQSSAGVEQTRAQPLELDLRSGLDETADLYFTFNNYSVGWELDGGQTCTSAGVGYVSVHGSTPEGLRVFVQSAGCAAMSLLGSGPEGTWTIDVVAYDTNGAPVAAAPRIEGVTLAFDAFTDLGVVTLAPCGVECP